MRKCSPFLLAALTIAWLAPGDGVAQESRLNQLSKRVQQLEQNAVDDSSLAWRIGSYLYPGFGVLVIAAFCALWARSTGRDPWLWLVAGLLFNVFALLAIAVKHEDDKKQKNAAQGIVPKA